MPGHPYTTLIFTLTCAAVTVNMVYVYPIDSLIGLGILLAGIPLFCVATAEPTPRASARAWNPVGFSRTRA